MSLLITSTSLTCYSHTNNKALNIFFTHTQVSCIVYSNYQFKERQPTSTQAFVNNNSLPKRVTIRV